jgi:hypothetical protein
MGAVGLELKTQLMKARHCWSCKKKETPSTVSSSHRLAFVFEKPHQPEAPAASTGVDVGRVAAAAAHTTGAAGAGCMSCSTAEVGVVTVAKVKALPMRLEW